MKEQDIIDAHEHSIRHRSSLINDKKCGCFYCKRIFSPQDIKRWIDDEQTALCPYCGIDSVIGESAGYPLTVKFLAAMRRKWF